MEFFAHNGALLHATEKSGSGVVAMVIVVATIVVVAGGIMLAKQFNDSDTETMEPEATQKKAK